MCDNTRLCHLLLIILCLATMLPITYWLLHYLLQCISLHITLPATLSFTLQYVLFAMTLLITSHDVTHCLHSFIHYEDLYSASSRLLLRSAPDPCTAKK